MAGKSISQTIRLEGADEMRRMLEEIGQTGGKAFKDVEAAVQVANSRLEAVAGAVEKVEKSFGAFNEAAKKVGASVREFGDSLATVGKSASAVVAAITGTAGGIVALARSAANASDTLVRNAQATGLATTEYQGLAKAAAQAGIEKEQFVAGFRKFAGDVVASAQKEKEAVVGLASEIAKLRFGDNNTPQPGVFKINITDLNKQLEQIKKIAPEIQQAFAQVGRNLSFEQVEGDLKKLVQSGVPVQEFFKALGAPLPPTNLLEALQQLSVKGDTALQKLGVRTTEFINGIQQIRPESAILEDVADKFSKLAEGPAKVAIAAELLGRAGPQFSAFLNTGREGMRAAIESFDQFNIRLSAVEIGIGQRMNRSLEQLGGTISGVKNKIGALFEPIIIEAADALRQKILENSLAIRQFAASIADQAVPIVRDLISLISGKDDQVKNGWILKARDAVVEFGTAAQSAVLSIVVPAFNALLAILQKVADGVNAVFGTTLTGGQIGIAIVIAQLIGAFGFFASILTAVGAAAGAFISTLGLIVPVLTTIAGLIGWPAVFAVALIALLGNLSSVQEGLGKIADGLNKLFGFALTGQDIMKGLAAAILAATAAINSFNAAALLLLRNPAFRAIALVATLFDTLSSAGKKVDGDVKQLDQDIKGSSESVDRLKRSLDGLNGGAGKAAAQPGVIDVAKQLKESGEAVDGFAGKMIRIAPAVDQAKQKAGELGQAVDQVRENAGKPIPLDPVKDLQRAWETLVAFLKTKDVNEALAGQGITWPNRMADAFDGAVTIMQGRLDSFVAGAKARFEELTGAIKRLLESLPKTEPGKGPGDSPFGPANLTPQPGQQGPGFDGLVQPANFKPPDFTQATRGAQDFTTAVNGAGSALNGIGTAVNAVNGALAGLSGNLLTDQTQAGAFADQMVRSGGALQGVGSAAAGAVPQIDNIGASLRRITDVAGQIQTLVQTAFSSISGAVSALASEIDAAIADIVSNVEAAIAKVGQLQSAAAQASGSADASGGGEGIPMFAGGGHVRGPGTSKSDSILARLSNDEFVQQAAATRYYGTGFMGALNAMLIPRELLRGTLRAFAGGGLVRREFAVPAFAGGGLVRRELAVPAFAGGGLVGAQAARHLGSLTLFDQNRQEIGTVMTDEETFAALGRVVQRVTRAAGGNKKPGWY